MNNELYRMNSEEKWDKINADAPVGANAFIESRFGFVEYIKVYHTGRMEVFVKGEWLEFSESDNKGVHNFIQLL